MNWLLDLLSLLGSALGLVNRKQELNNTPALRAAAQAQDSANQQSQAEKAVAQQDEKAVRNLLAE